MELERYGPLLEFDLEEIADEILIEEFVLSDDPVEIAFYLHQYVSDSVRYEARHIDGDSREFRTPIDCIKAGGNCEEQCVLLASLLESKGIPTQFIELERPNADFGHLSLRCQVTEGATEALDEISDLCASTQTVGEYDKAISVVVSSSGGLFSSGGKQRWYFADPVMQRYLGDPSGFRRNKYITEEGFDWKCSIRAFDPGRKKALSE